MTGTITIQPSPVSYTINGTFSVLQTVDQPSLNKCAVILVVVGAGKAPPQRINLLISGADYTTLCQKWATDQDLINFVATKYGLTA